MVTLRCTGLSCTDMLILPVIWLSGMGFVPPVPESRSLLSSWMVFTVGCCSSADAAQYSSGMVQQSAAAVMPANNF